MNGPSIRSLREGLGLNVHGFAEILGVHVSTLYRWEASRGNVAMDPLQGRILDQLAVKLQAKQIEERRQLGEQIKRLLLVGGALVALGFLIKAITEE